MEQNMFCYQCQETAGCTGCTKMGVCGKTPHIAALQQLLVWVTKGLSAVTTQMRREDLNVTGEINQLLTKNLFTTISNANFSVCCASATHLLLTIAPARKTARKKALSSALRRLSVFAKQRYKKAPTSSYEQVKNGCGRVSRGADMLIKYRKLWPRACISFVENE